MPLVRSGWLDKESQVYLNRLADFLFTVARMASKYDKRTESVYVPKPADKIVSATQSQQTLKKEK